MSEKSNAEGILISYPMTKNADGYAFVSLDDGQSVYVPSAVVDASEVGPGELRSRVAVEYYTRQSDNGHVATRLSSLLPSGPCDGERERVLRALNEIDYHLEKLGVSIDEAYAALGYDDEDED